MFLLSPHSDLADPVRPKPKVPNGTATTPQNPNPSALKDSVVDTATNRKLDPTSEEIAALKKKKEQEDMLKIGKNPKEFSKLKHEVRVPKSADFRLHKPYPCNQTYVTHNLCETDPKNAERKAKKAEKIKENERIAAAAEKGQGKGGKK